MDRIIVEGAVAAAKKTSKKDFGYTRNPELVRCGQLMTLFKMILDCARRSAPPTPRMTIIAERVDIDLSTYIKQPINDLLKELRKRRSEMWEEQKNC